MTSASFITQAVFIKTREDKYQQNTFNFSGSLSNQYGPWAFKKLFYTFNAS